MSDEKQANPLFRDAMASLGAPLILSQLMVMQDAVV